MDREKLIELVSAHLDGELEAEEQSELEGVLEDSEEARDLLASFKAQRGELGALSALKAPESLRDATKKVIDRQSPGSKKAQNSSSWLWILGSVAACLLFFFTGEFVQRSAVDQRFYLTAKGLVLSPLIQPEVVELTPEQGNAIALLSQPFRGKLVPGEARVSWTADAGTFEGARVRARLSLDIDGDSEYDVVQESELVALDAVDGFEQVSATFVFDESELSAGGPLQAKLELLAEEDDSEGVQLRFQPEHSHLVLPITGFKSV